MDIGALTADVFQSLDEKQVVEHVDARRVYLLDWGRNAWHSTWTVRYRRDRALFTTRQSAEREAERRRKRGTVFYVDTLPALVIRTSGVSCVLVDCHATTPFWDYRGCALPPEGALYPGASLRKALESFENASGFWRGPKPSPDAIITGLVEDIEALGDCAEGPMRKWRSYAQGTDWPLGWTRVERRVRRVGVTRLVEAFEQLRFAREDALREPPDDPSSTSEGLARYLMKRPNP